MLNVLRDVCEPLGGDATAVHAAAVEAHWREFSANEISSLHHYGIPMKWLAGPRDCATPIWLTMEQSHRVERLPPTLYCSLHFSGADADAVRQGMADVIVLDLPLGQPAMRSDITRFRNGAPPT